VSTELQTIEPDWAWDAFEPSEQAPWSLRRVAHLYRRAGFGANRGKLEAGLELEPAEIVDKLLGGSDAGDFNRQMDSMAATIVAGGDPSGLSAWWLYRMVHTPAPLVEQLTLFWHGHFATSAAKVNSARLMHAQNELFRKNAAGRFEDLVQGISRDPAMLIYLDSTTNRKIHPNENYARELMELFCLGLDQYSEEDIQELARCFTGWEVDHERFRFNRYQHDTGTKSFLGREGEFGGEDGVRVVLSDEAAPRFIAEKLVRYFVVDDDVPPPLIEPLARELRENDFQIGPTVRRILTSRMFFSEHALAQKIRSPVGLAVGLVRSLEASTSATLLAEGLQPLGQVPFYPPSVKGWDGGRQWINSTTLLGRANLVRSVVDDQSSRFAGGTLADLAEKYELSDSDTMVAWLGELLVAAPLPADAVTQLARLAEARAGDQHRQLADVIHAMSTLPEFHLT
jgi:hypothetical protein